MLLEHLERYDKSAIGCVEKYPAWLVGFKNPMTSLPTIKKYTTTLQYFGKGKRGSTPVVAITTIFILYFTIRFTNYIPQSFA